MCADLQSNQGLSEGYAPAENARLYYREIGQGPPIILIHGGPDFDHTYLLPDMDRLSDGYRLIYYDQRGRGRSAGDIPLEAVSIEQEIRDLDSLRDHLRLESAAVLGHSWGGVLAMEYALRHPGRVSHLILMNTCIATHEDILRTRQERSRRLVIHTAKLDAMRSSAAYAEGDPAAVTAFYRLVFSIAVKQPEHLDRLDMSFPAFTSEDILRARAIEALLYDDSWSSPQWTLIPSLKHLNTPTLIIHGDYDFIPADCPARVAQTVPNARFVLLRNCGHFAYIEAPDDVRTAIDDFFAATF